MGSHFPPSRGDSETPNITNSDAPHAKLLFYGLVAVQHRRKKTASRVVHLKLGFLHARYHRAMAENGMQEAQFKMQ